jgi:hypothetical protein
MTFPVAFICFFTQSVRIKFAEGTHQVKEQLAFWGAQIERLLDCLEDDVQCLQLVDDLLRPFQPASQTIIS